MRRLPLALALGAGLLLTADAGASAHNLDNNSRGTCYQQRTEWTSGATVRHSHPAALTKVYADYHCCLDLGGLSHRWNFSTLWWNGATSSHGWSPVYFGWCP